ncbi:hypothetical protein [Halosimplex marinum]|uniref:hypothetical protein n=1 Tax=Halosimplex marinum TaxID=3396620 RepID=UPI003F554903
MSEADHGAERIAGSTHSALADLQLGAEAGEASVEVEGYHLDDEDPHVEMRISLGSVTQRVILSVDEAGAVGEDLTATADELEEMGSGE